VTLRRVHRGQHRNGLRHGEAGLGETVQQGLGVWAADRHAVEVAQRGDQPVGAHRRLEHQGHRAARGDQRLRDALYPDGGAIEQVQVDVTVHQRAGAGSGQWFSAP
jgi:hypothetical protein